MRTTTFFLLASFLFACGGSDGTTPIPAVKDDPPKTGSSTTAEPEPPAPTTSECNTLKNDAEPLKAIAVVAIDAPAPTGGTIPSGTFHLQGITLYAGKSGKASSIPIELQGTVKVDGDKVEQVLDGERPDGTVVAERSTESIAT